MIAHIEHIFNFTLKHLSCQHTNKKRRIHGADYLMIAYPYSLRSYKFCSAQTSYQNQGDDVSAQIASWYELRRWGMAFSLVIAFARDYAGAMCF